MLTFIFKVIFNLIFIIVFCYFTYYMIHSNFNITSACVGKQYLILGLTLF
jgi:hypothetical protein